MADQIPARLINITLNGYEIECNTSANMSMTREVTATSPCKPTSGDSYASGGWVQNTEGDASFEITGSAKAIKDAIIASGKIKHSEIIRLFMEAPVVQVTFGTTDVSDFSLEEIETYSGSGILTGITWAAEGNEESNVDFTITGTGQPVQTITPVTS